jgi:ABC-type transport system involved in multi-copper enzyme maturation permease subunit
VQPWSKAGLIIAASTRPGAAYAAIMVTGGHGVRFQDDYTGDTAGSPGPAPRWLRLTRAGDTVTGYASADGRHWARVGQATLAGLPGQVPGGLFATSPAHTVTSQFAGGTNSRSGPSLATAAFARIGLRGGWAPGAWTGAAVDPGGAPVRGEWHQAGGTMLVTGAGDIAPAVFGPGLGYPSTSLEGTLTGAFVALIAVLVVAALFITGEYRRGLIKVTLAATPRRGRVLAAKAVVIAAAAGVAGLAGAVIAAVFGPALGRAAGLYVIPVSALTWARAVGGTAALLAVAAVLALAVGTLTRRGAVAVTTLILIVVLPYILAQASLLPVAAGQWLLRVTPAAGFAIQQTLGQYAQVSSSYTPANGFFPLAPWAGFAVLCGWAALALVLAAVALRRRDA